MKISDHGNSNCMASDGTQLWRWQYLLFSTCSDTLASPETHWQLSMAFIPEHAVKSHKRQKRGIGKTSTTTVAVLWLSTSESNQMNLESCLDWTWSPTMETQIAWRVTAHSSEDGSISYSQHVQTLWHLKKRIDSCLWRLYLNMLSNHIRDKNVDSERQAQQQ